MISQILHLLRRNTPNEGQNEPRPDWFDESWYLAQYPDVAISGMDAWRHFYMHGRHEGRMPCRAHACLWGGSELPGELLDELATALDTAPSLQANYAAWLLGRWYAVRHEWGEVLRYMRQYSTSIRDGSPLYMHRMPIVLLVEAMRLQDDHRGASRLLDKWEKREGETIDTTLARANLLHPTHVNSVGAHSHWLDQVNRIYTLHGLADILLPMKHAYSLDSLHTNQRPGSAEPCANELVTVIVPAFNASTRLKTAVDSILGQTWPQLEVLIINDASTDDTREVAYELASQDSRVRVIDQVTNQGAYAARNTGLRESRGDFLTVHDSDDWSHPQKIEQQVLALRNSTEAIASISHWVRANESLFFGSWQTPSGWAGWCHRNTSSLMFRRAVFNRLGFWDRVNCSADMEYYHRMICVYGSDSVVEVVPGVPLAIGRISSTSLTQASETSIFTIFDGLRQEYDQAFNAWHKAASSADELYLPECPDGRPFPVPKGMER